MENLPKIIQSSENPENLSLTLEGATVLSLIFLAHQAGYDISGNDALAIIEILIAVIASFTTLYGLVRKVINRVWT